MEAIVKTKWEQEIYAIKIKHCIFPFGLHMSYDSQSLQRKISNAAALLLPSIKNSDIHIKASNEENVSHGTVLLTEFISVGTCKYIYIAGSQNKDTRQRLKKGEGTLTYHPVVKIIWKHPLAYSNQQPKSFLLFGIQQQNRS